METGLYFGSFNPIHIGHLAIANYMVEYTDMEEVWFVVSPHNPLKDKSTLLENHHRLELVRLAIGTDMRFRASDIEFRLPKPSYTIDTLAYLGEQFPNKQFGLIMGSDNLNTLPRWKNYQEVLKNHHLYVYPRPGYPANPELLDEFKEMGIHMTEAPRMEISSEFIRRSIREKKNLNYFLPGNVFTYIREMHFYEK